MTSLEIGQALAALRERAGYTLRGFADALGVSTSTYSTYERGAFKKQFLPMEKVALFAPHLIGRGDPLITMNEVLALGGAGSNRPFDFSKINSGILSGSGIDHQIEQEAEHAVLLTIWDDLEDSDRKLVIRMIQGLLVTSKATKAS